MALPTRARIAGILAICLLMLSAPGALAGSVANFLPDAQIRLGSGSYVGDNIYNTDALGQSVSNTGVVDQKLTFFIKIQNDSVDSSDSFKVKRSGWLHRRLPGALLRRREQRRYRPGQQRQLHHAFAGARLGTT